MKCIIKNVEIKSIATYVPERVLELTSLINKFGGKEVEATIAGSGIERLHVAEHGQTTGDLCYEAAQKILNEEQIDRSTIDGLIFVSQTMDYYDPATSCVLQGRLKLSNDCVCMDIVYGCSGYIYGIFEAAALIGSGACKKVLVLAGETSSKAINQNIKSDAMVFGDAGSATLVCSGRGELGFHIMTDGYNYKTVMNPRFGFRHWPENLNPNWEPKESGMEGDEVFSFIIRVAPKTIMTTLEMMGWDKDEVDFYGLHQATKITVDFMRKKLKLAHPERAPFDIVNYGNTSPTTVPMVLTDWPYRAEGVDTSTWHKVILAAYGVGLSWGSIACDLSKTKIYRPINQ